MVKIHQTSTDSALIVAYLVFGFTALIFEPLYYFGCNWNEALCSQSSWLLVREAGKIWSIYDQWDPLFVDVPMWLQIMCSIEVFIFGPLYVVCAYGLAKRSEWLSTIALPFSGALIYSTLVYFGMEVLDCRPGTNLAIVFLVNIPWTILPMVLWIRVVNIEKEKKVSHTSKME